MPSHTRPDRPGGHTPAPHHQHLLQVLLEGIHVAVGLLQAVPDAVQHELVVLLHQKAALQHLLTLSDQLRGQSQVRHLTHPDQVSIDFQFPLKSSKNSNTPSPNESLPLKNLRYFPDSYTTS